MLTILDGLAGLDVTMLSDTAGWGMWALLFVAMAWSRLVLLLPLCLAPGIGVGSFYD